jgi:hypothetical protein
MRNDAASLSSAPFALTGGPSELRLSKPDRVRSARAQERYEILLLLLSQFAPEHDVEELDRVIERQ